MATVPPMITSWLRTCVGMALKLAVTLIVETGAWLSTVTFACWVDEPPFESETVTTKV